MKKKLIIIITGLVVIITAIILSVLFNKTNYTIKVSLVDDRSPDRILTVYNEKNEKIEVKRIELLDGTVLCNGFNTTVHYGNIENQDKLKVILQDKSEVIAKIVIEEVKK